MTTSTEIVPFETDISNIAPEDVSAAVDGCLDQLKAVQRKVNTAISKASKSKTLAENAKEIKKLKGVIFHQKVEAIEALQEAVASVADTQGEQSEAIQLLLGYQETISKGMKFLLALGIFNITNSRTVVKTLEMRLKKASKKELSDMARNETRAVIAQIKAQMDLFERQERLGNAQTKTNEQVSVNKEKISSLHEREERQDKLLEEQKQELSRQAKKDSEHEIELQRQAQKDQEHDAELKRQAEKDKELDMAIATIRKELGKHLLTLETHRRGVTMCKLALLLASASLMIATAAIVLAILKII